MRAFLLVLFVKCGASTSFPKKQRQPIRRRGLPDRASARLPTGGIAEAGNDRFCSCVSWSSEGLWILSFGRRSKARRPVRCIHGLEPSDRSAYCRNAPVLRLWSNRLGQPNAEIAQPCPQHCCGSSCCHHTPCGDGLRRPSAARGAQAVAVRFSSVRMTDRPELGAAEADAHRETRSESFTVSIWARQAR